MNHSEQRKQIRHFISAWQGRGYEKGESQKFWLELLSLLGVNDPFSFISFEDQVRLDHTSFIDGFISSTHVLIEQKSLGKDLSAPIKQSDGSMLTPFQQAKRYSSELPYSERPRWIVTCNFAEFLVYDMEKPNGEPSSILLKDLERELYRLNFLVKTQDEVLQRELEISLKAGELVGKLYDALLEQYIDPTSPHTLHSLNALCVRLVFCLYAEDAGLFATHTAFHDYLLSFNSENVRKALIDLFKILDTPIDKRDPYERPELLAFPYVNGGLFADETIEIPRFTLSIRSLILQDCSANFDWSSISPTIFGAVFESTLNPETRRSGGMHYTSIENIHKVIDPLFLDELNEELRSLESLRSLKSLEKYQDKLASLTFLDPACGSGNFLTETYLSLRRLENRVLRLLRGTDTQLSLGGDYSPIKVSISQFYGIEINDFAATVAKTALWIAESQMMQETEDIVGRDLDFLPLKSYTHITVGNALRTDWSTVGGTTLLSAPKPTAQVGGTTLLSAPKPTAQVGGTTLLSAQDPTNAMGRQECRPSYVIDKNAFLNKKKDVYIDATGHLPHWQQDSKIQFITFRLADSLPQSLLNEMKEEKEVWLKLHPKPWDETTEREYFEKFISKIDKWLDSGHGSCVLQNEEVAKCLERCLNYYNDVQYKLLSYVIMPNHVHIVAHIFPSHNLTDIVKAWKGVSARDINKLINNTSKQLWQKEYFDRIVRDNNHLERIFRYIEQNSERGGIAFFSPQAGWTTLLSAYKAATQAGGTTLLSAQRSTKTINIMGRQECRPSYIIGNPPFVGYAYQTKEQKDDIKNVAPEFGNNVDYVACWYYKAAEMMQYGKNIRAAFVSTNSITQGEQVAAIWKVLFNKFNIHIDFAYRTFRWDSEATLKAHVHCVIIGFSSRRDDTLVGPQSRDPNRRDDTLVGSNDKKWDGRSAVPPIIYDGETRHVARNINAYLLDADDVFIERRTNPLCNVPAIYRGSQPTDNGNYIFTVEEYEEFVKREPQSAKFFRPFMMGKDFIDRRPRYCLWLVDADPSELRKCPNVCKRIANVREFRLASKKEATRKKADTAMLFDENHECKTDYIAIPKVTSERRRYIPMDYLSANIIAGDKIFMMPNATLYHFGILTSNVHMAWMRAVCGRLKSDYSYSNTIVYNNFPWINIGGTTLLSAPKTTTQAGGTTLLSTQQSNDAEATGRQECRPSYVERIEQTAQQILDARALYPDSSLADLYDEVTMPPELRRAHQANDRAVMEAYGFPTRDFTESDIVAALMKLYKELNSRRDDTPVGPNYKQNRKNDTPVSL